jgi:molybdate transport system substrate-binding protein
VDLRLLSAGAVQRGVETAAALFEKESGHKIFVFFATAPVIRGKVENQELALDLLIAPLETIRDFEKQRLVASGSSAVVGSVKAAVVVRQGAWQPDISTAEALKAELIACESIVYNQGSSGIFAEELIQRMGIGEVVKAKTLRLADAGAVMKHLSNHKNTKDIGFGQITAILLHLEDGVKLVGPLPKEVENITTYAAAIATRAEAPDLAQRFLRFLITPSTQTAFRASGVT